jgi:hypothetical protein
VRTLCPTREPGDAGEAPDPRFVFALPSVIGDKVKHGGRVVNEHGGAPRSGGGRGRNAGSGRVFGRVVTETFDVYGTAEASPVDNDAPGGVAQLPDRSSAEQYPAPM